MLAVKRHASDSFSSAQVVVKRQRSSVELNNDASLTPKGGSQGGTVVQSVCALVATYSTQFLLNLSMKNG